jgi:capsular polysaccharide export protein
LGGRLGVLSLGFARQRAVRRILELAGWRVVPGPMGDAIGVWGRSRTAWRGLLAARLTGRPVLSIEEPVLRGFRPAGQEPPLGLVLDDLGVHFDAHRPSRLERILAEDPLEGGEAALALWRGLGLSRTNAWGQGPLPEPGFVLVVDQVRGDRSIAGGMAGPESFRRMLGAALAENPGARVLIRGHPRGAGHFGQWHAGGRVAFADPRVAPWALLQRAARVYAVTSQMGFEAILAGHRPRLFGVPFHAGWGLAEETLAAPRRGRVLTPAQLLAGAVLRYPVWHDPFADRLTDFATVAGIVGEQMRAWAGNAVPSVGLGVRAWKREVVARFLDGPGGPARFADSPGAAVARASGGGRVAVWAAREPAGLQAVCDGAGVPLVRLEDGFLRSAGLGARLVSPASLAIDPEGIHFDPSRPSRLERLVAASVDLPDAALARAAALRAAILAGGVTKYGLSGDAPDLPGGRVVLVLGQVEDDASVRLGAGAERTTSRCWNGGAPAEPDAVIVWKPHPDVEAGLRPGAVPPPRWRGWPIVTLSGVDAAAALAVADEVWTVTSTLGGFEALLRGLPVTCLGVPFYAGWGLTRDLGPVPARRQARPGLTG